MSFFAKKVNLEEYCGDFYDNIYLNPMVEGVDASKVLPESSMKLVADADSNFAKVSLDKLAEEIVILQFELFALAWTHKFISGKPVIYQSAFTKQFLHDRKRDDIWMGMDDYTKIIDGGTLHWLTGLSKVNLGFNYNMREDLTAKNLEEAKQLGIDSEDIIERVNYRIWSENAWRQKIILAPLVGTLCGRLNIDPKELNRSAQLNLSYVVRMIYDGARKSIDKIKL